MPVLIGVGGGPALGQHKYNRAYFQTLDRYTWQKTFRRCLLLFLKYTIFIINYLGRYSQ